MPKPIVVLCSFAIAVFVLPQPAPAAVVEVDITITAVDAKAREITVGYESKTWQKTIQLVLASKAEITLDGKQATLEAVKPGQKASVSFDKELLVVTKIAAGEGTPSADSDPIAFGAGRPVSRDEKSVELVELAELNDDSNNDHAWLSEDGLTIYWDRSSGGKGTIWTAHRENAESLFGDNKSLFAGKCPTVSSDGLEMILVGNRADGDRGMSLHVAIRATVNEPFGRPKEISELAGRSCWAPCLRHDGLALYFLHLASQKDEIPLHSTRMTTSSSWSKPKGFTDLDFDSGSVQLSFVTTNGLTFFGHQSNGERNALVICSRSSKQKPFEEPKHIEVRKHPVVGVWPRYVAATHELFFAGRAPLKDGPMNKSTPQAIWVVKNFTLPDASK